ncbi:MAG TPA: hypothetical protein VNQ77_01965 [Frankiaceae bacterium]|nr:hypothetical protein [Frankiaceae bacterium]
MTRSRLVAVAALSLVASATPAYAAKKPVICNLIKDTAGDAGLGGAAAAGTTYDPSLDILSADLAVSSSMLTAVIRVKDLTKDDTLAPTGRTWNISFTNGTQSVGMSAYLSPLGGEQFSTKKGVFDYAKDQIRIHVALADIPNAKIKKGSVLRGFYLATNVVVGLDPSLNAGSSFAPLGGSTDSTTSTAAFTVGSLSCVKVGK